VPRAYAQLARYTAPGARLFRSSIGGLDTRNTQLIIGGSAGTMITGNTFIEEFGAHTLL